MSEQCRDRDFHFKGVDIENASSGKKLWKIAFFGINFSFLSGGALVSAIKGTYFGNVLCH